MLTGECTEDSCLRKSDLTLIVAFPAPLERMEEAQSMMLTPSDLIWFLLRA